MGLAIETLATEVVHLIAAGEVIDSLAAVVRELAENALDAGATRITIDLFPEQWRIRLADNGAGMALADLKQAAAPHSTSKIRGGQDLWKLTSLGFRGEALHSLAQLSELEIVSRPATESAGWQIAYSAQGQPSRVEPVAIAPGTVVTASHLFSTWSARREGFPPLAQQLREVQAIVQQLALSHPQITWQVQQNDRPWFSLWGGATARQILPQILRDVQLGDLQELTVPLSNPSETIAQDSIASLYLVLGLPDRCHRHRPDWVRVALNGRLIQLPELEQTILSSFRRTLPRDRFPICLVHLRVPPEQIDWNRHPAKSEVYLHHLDTWRAQVAAAIDQALNLNPSALPESLYSTRLGNLIKTAESAAGYSPNRQIQPQPSEDSPTPPLPNPPTPLPHLRALSQVHSRYILAEHPSGVWLIEQHIAHERVLYEQLCDRWEIVPLPSPIVLSQLTPGQVEQLRQIGLEVEPFGDQVWMVRTAPEMLAQREDCADALLELSLGGDLQTAQVATACRSAIRNGTPLSLAEMQTLLEQWQQTRHPRTCPHGRPICLTLEETTLSRFFPAALGDRQKSRNLRMQTLSMEYLYLHGFASSPRSLKAQVLARRFAQLNLPLLIPDLNQGDFAHLTLTRQLHQVEALLTDTPTTLIGSSLGGLTAAWLAERNPQIDRLVLLAPAFGFLDHWLPRLGEAQMQQWRSTGSLAVYHYSEQQKLPLRYEFVSDAAQYDEAKIQRPVPTLILHGLHDEVIPIESSRSFAHRPWVSLIELDSDHALANVSAPIWQAIQIFCSLPHSPTSPLPAPPPAVK